MNVSELSGASNITPVLKAYLSYQNAVAKDSLSRVDPSAKLPDAHVFFSKLNGALIIILPERHDSTDDQVRDGAWAVAKHVLAIPKVKIAVEEPISHYGVLLSDVGWAKDVGTRSQYKPLFEFDANAQGSISHQIYVRQTTYALVTTSRYAAEKMPRVTPRYGNPAINKTMADNLIANTKAGETSVFPVGPDHLLARYDLNTLTIHLKAASWKLLKNN